MFSEVPILGNDTALTKRPQDRRAVNRDVRTLGAAAGDFNSAVIFLANTCLGSLDGCACGRDLLAGHTRGVSVGRRRSRRKQSYCESRERPLSYLAHLRADRLLAHDQYVVLG